MFFRNAANNLFRWGAHGAGFFLRLAERAQAWTLRQAETPTASAVTYGVLVGLNGPRI